MNVLGVKGGTECHSSRAERKKAFVDARVARELSSGRKLEVGSGGAC